MLEMIRYVGRILSSLEWGLRRPPRRRFSAALVAAVCFAAAAAYAGDGARGEGTVGVEALIARAVAVDSLLARSEAVYEAEFLPIEQVLLTYRDDDVRLVRRIAVALVREAARAQLDPGLLLALLLVENPWLDPAARSVVGAQGLMQVMPLHLGRWSRCEPRLDDVESNICHGAQIFAAYLAEERGSVDRALLRYNGCVRGTNTPDCHQFPMWVFARAGRATLLGWRPSSRGSMGAAP